MLSNGMASAYTGIIEETQCRVRREVIINGFHRGIEMSRREGSAGEFLGRLFLVGCVMTAIVIPAPGAEKIQLGLHLKQGQTFNLTATLESKLTENVMGQEMNAASTTGLGYTYEIQQVADDGVATCKVNYKSVQVKMAMAGFDIEYDSAKPSASVSPFVKPFSALVGQSFTMRISPTGKVTDVQGVEAIYEKMLKGMEVPDESMRGMMEQMIKEQFGADAIRESMEQAIGVNFPDKPVDVGDSWVKRTVVRRPYPMNYDSTYTLKERKSGVAVIVVVSKISSDPAAKPMQIGPMTMAYDVSGERKGQVEIEESSGWTVAAQYTQQISGAIKAEGGPMGPISFPISGTITTRMETKK